MKGISGIILLLATLTGRTSAQGLPLLPTPEKDPFVGTWQVNLDKSWPRLGKKGQPFSVMTIIRDGDDLVFSSQTATSATNGEGHRVRCDGRFHSVPSDATQSCKYDAPNYIEGEWRPATFFEGKPDGGERGASYWAREVSADGQEMKFAMYRDRGRMKITQVVVLDRVSK